MRRPCFFSYRNGVCFILLPEIGLIRRNAGRNGEPLRFGKKADARGKKATTGKKRDPRSERSTPLPTDLEPAFVSLPSRSLKLRLSEGLLNGVSCVEDIYTSNLFRLASCRLFCLFSRLASCLLLFLLTADC